MRKGLKKLPKAPTFLEGEDASVELPTTGVLSELRSVLGYDLAVAGGTGAGDVHSDAAFRTHRMIGVNVQGNQADATLHKAPGHTFGMIERMFSDGTTPQTNPTTDAAGTDEDDRVATIPIPFYVPWSDFGDAAALPLSLAKPNVTLSYFNGKGVFTKAADGTVTIANGAQSLYGDYLYGENLVGNPRRPYAHFDLISIRSIVKDVSASGEEPVYLTHLRPGMDLLDVTVEGLIGGAALEQFVYSDALVTKAGLEVNGVKENELVDFARIQDKNARDFHRSSVETGVAVFSSHVDRDTRPGKTWRVVDGTPRVDLEYTYQGSDQNRIVVTTIARVRGIPVAA